MALNKKNRLKKKKDFDCVFKRGKAVKGNFLFAKFSENELGFPRIAFIVSSKVSKKAVIRNKIRRILSEISKTKLEELGSVDVALVADKRIIDTSKDDIGRDLDNVFKKIK